MTAPVITAEQSTDDESGLARKLVTMQFVLPFDYTMENVRRPTDPRVSVKEALVRKYGVLTFSGVAGDAWGASGYRGLCVGSLQSSLYIAFPQD